MIHFVDIGPDNWRLDLKVAESQKTYVASSAVMLARAYAYREQRSRAFVIYDDETPVGMQNITEPTATAELQMNITKHTKRSIT